MRRLNVSEWRIIPGFNNYEVSNFGDIRRSVGGKGTWAGRILKPWGIDYLMVGLWHDGKYTAMYNHHAVALAFIGPKPSGHEAAHDDGNKKNNAAENIFWKTPIENAADRIRHGTDARGSKSVNSKITEDDVLRMRWLRSEGRTLHSLASEFGICMQNVDLICRNHTWQSVGGPITTRSMAKLNIEVAQQIKRRLLNGEKRRKLAKEFKVTYGTISHIAKERSWKDIQ